MFATVKKKKKKKEEEKYTSELKTSLRSSFYALLVVLLFLWLRFSSIPPPPVLTLSPSILSSDQRVFFRINLADAYLYSSTFSLQRPCPTRPVPLPIHYSFFLLLFFYFGSDCLSSCLILRFDRMIDRSILPYDDDDYIIFLLHFFHPPSLLSFFFFVYLIETSIDKKSKSD